MAFCSFRTDGSRTVCFAGVSLCCSAHCTAAAEDPGDSRAGTVCTLPGVGESRAEAILKYREQHGLFERVEDAANVPGLTGEIVASWEGQAIVR